MQDTLQMNEWTDRFLFLRPDSDGKMLDRYFTDITQLLQVSFLLSFNLISDKKLANFMDFADKLKELVLMKDRKREASLVKNRPQSVRIHRW